MSSAHRPTWTPAMGKDARLNTKQYSSRDIAAHTKLKFRQPGQNSKSDLSRRDLKLELELAEKRARILKRKQAGLLPLPEEDDDEEQKETQKNSSLSRITNGEDSKDPEVQQNGNDERDEDEVRMKRRRVLEQALLADRDDSDSDSDDSDDDGKSKKNDHQNGSKNNKTDERNSDNEGDEDDEEEDDDSDDSDDDESETAELMKELEKIKRERAEEKARQEREAAQNEELDKETKAAIGNPLLNLKAALNNGNLSPTNSISSSTMNSSVTNSNFSIKRRWDDDVIFKNQARDVNENPKKEFVNDLLRTEFHRRFLKKFIA